MSKSKLILFMASLPLFVYLWPSFLGGDTNFIPVAGKSMLPTIEGGTLVIAKSSEYDVSDIVAFSQEEELHGKTLKKIVVHRIVEKVDGGFKTKGDNNPGNDPGITPPDKIIGKVIYVVPYLGYAAMLLKNPIGLMLTLAASGLSLIPTKRKKSTKKESLFIPATLANLISYTLLMVAISSGTMPSGDIITNFLFKIFEPYVAGTMAFAVWHMVIMGTLMLEKNDQRTDVIQVKAGKALALKGETVSMHSMIQILLLMVITLRMIHAVGILGHFIEV